MSTGFFLQAVHTCLRPILSCSQQRLNIGFKQHDIFRHRDKARNGKGKLGGRSWQQHSNNFAVCHRRGDFALQYIYLRCNSSIKWHTKGTAGYAKSSGITTFGHGSFRCQYRHGLAQNIAIPADIFSCPVKQYQPLLSSGFLATLQTFYNAWNDISIRSFLFLVHCNYQKTILLHRLPYSCSVIIRQIHYLIIITHFVCCFKSFPSRNA